MNPLSRSLSVLALVPLIMLSVSEAEAQSTGVVTGRVTDSQVGGVLPGAVVRLDGTPRETATNREGVYRLQGVAPGEYTLSVEYLGFEPFASTVSVSGGETVSVDASLSRSGFEESVVVTAPILEGQAKALNQQRNALNIMNVVAADQIGSFPDSNAAEAVQRVPGVSIERDQGEGRYVLVRGTEARLNSMMINGERVPSPEGDVRQVALDVIPADLLQSIEVTKTLTPDMDADSIGGSVNLVTQQAPQNQRIFLVAGLGHNAIREDTLQRGIFSYGNRFDDDKVGLTLSGSIFNTDRGSDNFEAAYDDGEVDELEIRHYTINRRRIGVNGAVDLRTSDGGSLILNGIYNSFRDQEYRRRTRNRVGDDRMERELKDRLETQEIISASLNGTDYLSGRLQLDYRLAYSYADEDEPDRRDTTFRLDDVVFAPNVTPDSIDPDNIQANPLGDDIAGYTLDEQAVENNKTTDRDLVAAVSLKVPVGTANSSFKLGGKYRDKRKDRDVEVDVLESDDDLFLSSVLDSEFGNGTPFLDGRYVPGPHVSSGGARSLTPRLTGEKDIEGDLGDYDAKEKTLAGFAMAELSAGEKLVFLPGVRVENTSVNAAGNQLILDEDGDFESLSPVTTTKDYTAWFPYAHVRYQLGERTNLRAAFTRSMARPNYYDLVPYEFVIREDEQIERGNPNLEPTLSWNFDLLFEHFFQNVGLVSAGAFHKNLQDFIFPFTFEELRDAERFDVIEPRNGESATLTGFEFAFQRRTAMGLGLYTNYTYTTSAAELPGRQENKPLPGQPEHFGNIALTYEKGGFSGKAAYVFHGNYIYGVGSEAAEDIYKDTHDQLDVVLSQKLGEKIRVFVELNNVTNEPLRFYEGTVDRPISEEYYKWWGTLGIQWEL